MSIDEKALKKAQMHFPASMDGWVRSAIEAYEAARSKPEPTPLTEEERQDVEKIIADRFRTKMHRYEAAHNADVYAEWSLDALLNKYDLRRK